ncbi:MAG: helix-turn-helix domain-containing protein [Thermoplasmata archaeon]
MPEEVFSEAEERMYAATFKARHNCVVGNQSRENPALRILHWCLNNRDIFQVTGPKDQVGRFEAWIEQVFSMRQSTETKDGTLMITRGCACATIPDKTITNVIDDVGAWEIPPIVYEGGWESWRVITWDEVTMRKLFRGLQKIGEVDIRSLRPIENAKMEQMMLMPAADVFAELTERQISALNLGLEHGYYSLPSETKVENLAQGAGLSPSTFSEHLRKAETRILRNLRPYLEAYATRGPNDFALGRLRHS